MLGGEPSTRMAAQRRGLAVELTACVRVPSRIDALPSPDDPSFGKETAD